MNVLKEGDLISFKSNDRIYKGNYYFLGIYQDGKIQVSENKSFETMHFAQNWLIDSNQIIYDA